ncbi:hypothetical protein C2R22_09835 [Salinigranum rubrum]|uniref:DUF4240 domain-containing protein n=1 Tax=Salinigranum rubrum TaxID=755307 RepID=A0A2I8VJ08_9EURY|nr:hypothetical protein [Salinigranum rubrum]AUV81912.1 hypothetical protein C2R22_09835 [Salinigranum rubrum]
MVLHVRRWLSEVWERLESLLTGEKPDESDLDLYVEVTLRAVVDAVVPETPELADELGPEHVPGGLAVGMEEFLVTFVDDLFQFGFPHVGTRGNLPLSAPLVEVLDAAADALVAHGDNEAEPDVERVVALLGPGDPPARRVRRVAGTFAKLSRRDRLRALGILDEFELRVAPFGHGLFEFDAGLVGQLVVGFAEMIYYSEWQGYDDFSLPPSERTHPNDPAAVQSWRQTGYPGVADGYAALRGYVGTDDSPLGAGDTWTDIDGRVSIVRESGSFRENDYDTTGYEEPYPE